MVKTPLALLYLFVGGKDWLKSTVYPICNWIFTVLYCKPFFEVVGNSKYSTGVNQF